MIRFDKEYRIEHTDRQDGLAFLSENGSFTIHGGLQDPDAEETEKLRAKMLKAMDRLKKTPMFTVYMGKAKKMIAELIEEARDNGIEVHLLECDEEWDYDFIAIRSNEFEVDGEVFRYNPFNEIELHKELVFTPNDLRPKKFFPYTFFYGCLELAPGDVPVMIKAQLIALEQAVEVPESSTKQEGVTA